MRQAYDYWQDQPGTYHRRHARLPGPARQGAGPNARSRVRAPTRARAPQGPASRRAPSRFVGRHAASARSRRLRMPGASPHASEERASGRPGGRAAHAGWPPRALARQPPACAALSLGPVQAASDARASLPAPRRSVPQAGPGAELPMRDGPRGRSFASPRPAPPSASAQSRRLQTPGRVSPLLGGACLRPARGPSCPCGVAPAGARSPAPGLRRPQPRPGPGGFRRPGASPRASEERASGRAGGRADHAGWPPRALAHQPPACAVLAWPDRVPASWFTRSERRRLQASSRGMPLGTVRLRTATRTKACDPSATASALPLGRPPPTERHLQVTRRPPLASRPRPVSTRRRTGARIRTPHGRPPARAWLRRRAELAPWPPPEALPPCALRADPTRLPHTICSGTMRACENGGPPPLPFSGGEERPPPLPKWEGRREASSSSPPVFGRGGASGAQAGGPRPRPGSRLSAAHLRTGGEEECTGTADTNPGCNYLVRGYSPSMHYFWRGDMPHFSPPLPFQPRAGARPRRARSGAPACAGLRQSPTPAAGASSTSAGQSGAPARAGLRWSLTPADGVPSTSAGQSRAPAHARRRRSPNPCGGRAVDLGRPDTLADGGQPVRRGMTAAISNWPAAPAAGQPKQARAPVAGGLAPFSHYF